ncbi:MAG: hypothetical protein WCL37_07185 [Chrysiogenales bacterium]
MVFNELQKQKIESLIKKGVSMYAIAQAIGGNCTWTDIQIYCWQTGKMSWLGSKRIITNSLNKLTTATTENERKKLAETINKNVKYLYYLGKEMRNRVVEITKLLKKIEI